MSTNFEPSSGQQNTQDDNATLWKYVREKENWQREEEMLFLVQFLQTNI